MLSSSPLTDVYSSRYNQTAVKAQSRDTYHLTRIVVASTIIVTIPLTNALSWKSVAMHVRLIFITPVQRSAASYSVYFHDPTFHQKHSA